MEGGCPLCVAYNSPSTKATTLFRRRKQASIVDSSGTISFELKTMFLVQNIPRSEGSVCLMRTFELVLTPTRTMEKFPFFERGSDDIASLL